MAYLAPQTLLQLSFAIAKISDRPPYPFSPSLSSTSLENHRRSPSFHFWTDTSAICRLGGLRHPKVVKMTLKKTTNNLMALPMSRQQCGHLRWGATLQFASRVRRHLLEPARLALRPRLVQDHLAPSLVPSRPVSCPSIRHLDWPRLNPNLLPYLLHLLLFL